ncbi:hypothetical protein EJB05_14705, partial [Eragrostis curvula]
MELRTGCEQLSPPAAGTDAVARRSASGRRSIGLLFIGKKTSSDMSPAIHSLSTAFITTHHQFRLGDRQHRQAGQSSGEGGACQAHRRRPCGLAGALHISCASGAETEHDTRNRVFSPFFRKTELSPHAWETPGMDKLQSSILQPPEDSMELLSVVLPQLSRAMPVLSGWHLG